MLSRVQKTTQSLTRGLKFLLAEAGDGQVKKAFQFNHRSK